MSNLNLQSATFLDQVNLQVANELSSKISNPFALPKLAKISINVGATKNHGYETKQQQEIAGYLQKITNQKPKFVQTRKSIANFKSRKGEIVGINVTLRGKKMADFLVHLIYVALPRSRDFKGLKLNAFDKNYGTYSIGLPTATIFPAVGFDATVQFGMQINLVFKTPMEENRILLQKIGIPFAKN
jgi:large subunit ribosomal protein L5